jgi:hypothetical protein
VISGGGGHRAAGQKAGSAIYRASLGRVKGHRGLLIAPGADYRHLDALSDSGILGRRYSGQAIVLGLLAGPAAFRFVLQALIVKEDLLAHSPGEWFGAIDAPDRSILKVKRLIVNDLLRPLI